MSASCRKPCLLFYARGFTGTTLDDIAHELGVTKPFIYAHFKSKTDLLAAICLPMMLNWRSPRRRKSPRARARRPSGCGGLVVDFTSAVLHNQASIAIYFRDERSLPREIRGEIDAMRRKFDRILSKLLQEGVAAGEFELRDVEPGSPGDGWNDKLGVYLASADRAVAGRGVCDEMLILALQMAGARTAASECGQALQAKVPPSGPRPRKLHELGFSARTHPARMPPSSGSPCRRRG